MSNKLDVVNQKSKALSALPQAEVAKGELENFVSSCQHLKIKIFRSKVQISGSS